MLAKGHRIVLMTGTDSGLYVFVMIVTSLLHANEFAFRPNVDSHILNCIRANSVHAFELQPADLTISHTSKCGSGVSFLTYLALSFLKIRPAVVAQQPIQDGPSGVTLDDDWKTFDTAR